MCVCAYVCVFLHGIHWIMGFIPVCCWRHLNILGHIIWACVLTCLHTLLLICIPGFPRCCGLNCQILRLLKSPCSPISCKIWWVESPFYLFASHHRCLFLTGCLSNWMDWTDQQPLLSSKGVSYEQWMHLLYMACQTDLCVCVLRRTSFHLGVTWTWGSYISLWVYPWNIMEFPVTWDMLRAFHHAAFGSCSTW